MKTVGITACSNALCREERAMVQRLTEYLESTGRCVLQSACIYEKTGPFSGTGKERAEELMQLFRNPEVEEIYDISGGDMANEVLDWLDFDEIARSRATFWGYSDLTTVLNAIYARTGKASVLWQVRHMAEGGQQELERHLHCHREELFCPEMHMVQGQRMQGIVVGGNIRCFLKLLGTPYFPDLQDKILVLEAWHGQVPQMVTYLAQMRSCGVFDKIQGILLGTFTDMEEQNCQPDIVSLVQSFVGDKMPIAVTREIGHGEDARALWIGEEITIQ